MSFIHKTVPSFWRSYNGLPEDVRRRCDKQYELLIADPAHNSVQLKRVGAFDEIGVQRELIIGIAALHGARNV